MAIQKILKDQKCRVGILSLGCPKTLVDSELVLGKLDARRYTIASSISDCDVAILNTCAFIQDAQQESIDHILRLIELKKEGEIQKLIVLGCLVQRFVSELQKELGEVDAFVGSGEYHHIPSIIESVWKEGKVTDIGVAGYLYTSAEKRFGLTPRHYRYLKISEGCDHACSFCVIPSFRGKHRSRELDDVVREAEILISEGAKELILTGQDTTFFGYDTEGKYLLPELLHRLDGIKGIDWIRILYAYPTLVTDELVQAIAALKKVCHYLDMPLQHVSDRILKSMRRGTTHDSTLHLIQRLRNQIPDIIIRTTFIVGYPGETEDEFQELLDFMQEARFERLGIFTYSPEQGSVAASLPGQIATRIKEKRLERGMMLQKKISAQNNKRFLGKTLKVIVEDRKGENLWVGRSYMDAPEVDGVVYISAHPNDDRRSKIRPGEFVSVRISDIREYDLVSKLNQS